VVELQGFRQFAQKGLVLSVGQKLDLPVTLQIGQLSDSVTVTGEAPFLQTANAEVADVIGNREVVQLPLNGRQFLQLAQLGDSVVIPPGGTRGAALEQAGSLPAVAGQRSGHNIYLLDRVKVTDEFFNNLVIFIASAAMAGMAADGMPTSLNRDGTPQALVSSFIFSIPLAAVTMS